MEVEDCTADDSALGRTVDSNTFPSVVAENAKPFDAFVLGLPFTFEPAFPFKPCCEAVIADGGLADAARRW